MVHPITGERQSKRSTIGSTRNHRPFPKQSLTKSIAHCWFGSVGPSGTTRRWFPRLRRRLSQSDGLSSRYPRSTRLWFTIMPLRCRRTCSRGLPQNPNDLSLGESAIFHDVAPRDRCHELLAGIPSGGKVNANPRIAIMKLDGKARTSSPRSIRSLSKKDLTLARDYFRKILLSMLPGVVKTKIGRAHV